MGMIDVSGKNIMERTAVAEGRINLREKTIAAIRKKEVRKGDVLFASELAAISGVKKTPDILPYCHQVLIEDVDVDFKVDDSGVICWVTVKSTGRTGVEMDALMGVSIALNSIWDMVKYLEKDEKGQYPHTSITDIRIVKKVKSDGR